MQIISNLHEMSELFSWKSKKNIMTLWSAEYAQRVVKVKMMIYLKQQSIVRILNTC